MTRQAHAVTEPVVSVLRGDGARASQGLMALLRERHRLSEPVRAPSDLFTPDALDVGKDLEEEQLWLAVSERRKEIQGQIEEAVRLLFEGQYGRCVDCRMAIPLARLRALPFAIRCLTCQECLEKRNRPMASWSSVA
jgi:DnaK suppressor protein